MSERIAGLSMGPGATVLQASLIIPTRNRSSLLRETIQSLFGGQYVPAELIIVDQSEQPDPTLKSFQPAGPCSIRYVWSSSRGISPARNEGIALATQELIAFTDDDMLMDSGWFGRLVHALIEAGPGTIVTGRVLAGPPEGPGHFAPSVAISEIRRVYKGRQNTDVLAAGNMATYRSVLDDVGAFDTRLGAGSHFPAAEDNDFGFRALERGHRIVYVPEALLYHRAWRDGRAFLPMRWAYGRGQGAFYAKHFTDGRMIRRMVMDIGRRLLRMPANAARGRSPARDLVFIAGLFAGATGWLRNRYDGRPD